ncbi:TPA: hypothetical protein QDB15_000070 [Burkholderia vietnamiensis]|uniref:Uncharacterized protein n=1 Tax=Pandoraea apista TaxID=93218 RepID=A0A5E5P293_9BURK|nr:MULTISPECIES: hypothetical protein [Burkholderiaceae]MCA8206344.1 hypothetical protein [Burkholderia vietnamiensis]VVG70385.1 hypothetical protein PAP18089_01345 [Pandoraea apista]HDR8943142.1 hypothetical protein [Burkholderia vietnamiensis]HDR9116346.1 hypothetical protein [Burkholderia vietnamiensis]HDR9205392.1 hypothetical protein [Burkholderia vietnamiensis]
MKLMEIFRRQIEYLVGASALICLASTSMAQSAPAIATASAPASASAASTGLYCDDPAHAGARCCQLPPAARDKDDLCNLIPNIKVAQGPGGSLVPPGALNGIVVSPANGKLNLESLAPGGLK